MEQKRTIWITLAAGIFLLVVIGAAVILYKGSAVKSITTTLVENDDIWVTQNSLPLDAKPLDDTVYSGFATTENTQTENEEQAQLSQTSDIVLDQPLSDKEESSEQTLYNNVSSDNVTVYATGNTTIYPSSTTTIDLTSSVQSNVKAQNQVAKNAMEEVEKAKTVNVTESSSAKSADTSKTTDKPVVSKSNTSTPATNTKSNKSTATSAASSSNKTSTTVTKATEKIPDRFWVQAASYTSVKNADEARAILESKKIQCEVFTYTDEKGTIYYRVRVGPYTTKSEAEYWKSKIDAIDLFAKNGTYITNSSARK